MPSTSSTRRPVNDAIDEGTGAPAAARVRAVVADLATASAWIVPRGAIRSTRSPARKTWLALDLTKTARSRPHRAAAASATAQRWSSSSSRARRTSSAMGSRSSVLQLADDGAVGDGGADLGLEAGDHAGFVGLEWLLHLHRLEHHHDIALDEGLTFRHCHLDDGALHRAGDGVATGGGAGLAARPAPRLLGTGRGTAHQPAQTARQHDLQPLAADLDGDPLPFGDLVVVG